MFSQDVGSSRASVVSSIVRLAVWIAVGVPAVLLFALVAFAPFTTGIPLWMGLLLVVVNGAVLVGTLRGLHTLLSRSLALIGGFTAVAVITVVLSQMLACTPPVVGDSGRPLPGSIASLEQIELNGSRQWVTIRGTSRENAAARNAGVTGSVEWELISSPAADGRKMFRSNATEC